MKLLAYIINNQKVGVEKTYWNNSDLNGNNPFITINNDDIIPENYGDITSIVSWGKFGETAGLDYGQVRLEIKSLKIEMASGFTSTEISTLNQYGLVDYYILYDFLRFTQPFNSKKPPYEVDYDLWGFHKKKYHNKGELRKIEYYANYDFPSNTYKNIVVKEDITYYRLNEMVYRLVKDISWFLDNGNTGATKTITKYLTLDESIILGEDRRRTIISQLKIKVIGLLQMTSGVTQTEAEEMGMSLIDIYGTNIVKYIEGVGNSLVDALNADITFSWLNNVIPDSGGITIRQYLISELTIDYTENNTYV